jgi:CBS-domain-containing membrane protein
MDALAAGETTDITALTRGVEPLRPDASIGQVLKLLDYGAGGVPVADADGVVIGWVRHQDVLTALLAPAEGVAPQAPRTAAAPPLPKAPTPV